jgi:predicted GNAT superfamily acetyltransferase
MPPAIETWNETTCRARADVLAAFFQALWPDDDLTDLPERMAMRRRVSAVVALADDGSLAGCKLGSERRAGVYHSWLGGVAEGWRGQGLAARLMAAQHAMLADDGWTQVETSTRQGNAAMAILNLRAGFLITGLECPPGQPVTITFARQLVSPGPLPA